MQVSRLLLFSFLFFLAACTKDPARQLSEEESTIYITNRDETADFSSYQSFALADSVVVISNNQMIEKVRTEYDAAIINAIAAEMEAKGYTRVAHGTGAGLGITVSRIYNDYTGIVDYTDYWDYYGGYWDPYYWGYPGYDYYYPGSFGVYTITDGGVTVDMIDLDNANNNNQLRLVWSGLIRGKGTFNSNLASKHAQALFSQSPYIVNP